MKDICSILQKLLENPKALLVMDQDGIQREQLESGVVFN